MLFKKRKDKIEYVSLISEEDCLYIANLNNPDTKLKLREMSDFLLSRGFELMPCEENGNVFFLYEKEFEDKKDTSDKYKVQVKFLLQSRQAEIISYNPTKDYTLTYSSDELANVIAFNLYILKKSNNNVNENIKIHHSNCKFFDASFEAKRVLKEFTKIAESKTTTDINKKLAVFNNLSRTALRNGSYFLSIKSTDKISTLMNIHNLLLKNNFCLTKGANDNEIYIRIPSPKEKASGRKIETIKIELTCSDKTLPKYSFKALESGKYKNSELNSLVTLDYIIYDAILRDDFVLSYNFELPDVLKKKKYNPDNFPYIKASTQIISLLYMINLEADKH